MKKYFSSVLAAAISTLLLTPASAEHEWTKVDNSTIENDLWTLNASWNNGALTLNGATPKDGSLTTLDVSEMNIGGKLLNSINSWQNNKIQTVKKLIIPYQMNNFTTEGNAIPGIEEICTPDGGHELSIKSWGKALVHTSNLTGDYVIKDIATPGNNNGGLYSCPLLTSVEFRGSYAAVPPLAAFLSYGIKSLSFVTTADVSGITAIPKQLCGHWGDQGGSSTPCQLTSLTLNGEPLLRNANIVTVGEQAMPHCAAYTDIVDLPNCTSLGNYAFRHTGFPFVNLMSVTSVGSAMFANCASLDRLVFGSETAPTFTYVNNKGELFQSAFGSVSAPVIIWNAKTAPASLRNESFLYVTDNKVTNYVRKEATGWASIAENIKQNFVSMDTAFKVNLRLGDKVVLTTLMPGVSGENSVWTIPASWFLAAGQTFAEGMVRDSTDVLISGASAIPDSSGLNLTITLPSSRVVSVDGTTQEAEVFVDLVAQESRDPQISVKIVGADDKTVVNESFEATVGTSVTRDYSTTVFGNDEYYFNNVLSLTVNPEDAATATFGLDAKLTLENIAKDAEIIVKIDRAARPTQLAYWNVDSANYTMSDGVWTFRCDFTGGRSVIANATEYKGSDHDVAEVDFTKPIGTDGSSDYQVMTLDWGATINGTAVDTTKTSDHCGKDGVINGGAGAARTLVGNLKIPATVDTITGWGYCSNLTMDLASLANVSTFGNYALAYTVIEGALSFADDNVVTIANSAFEKSYKISSLSIPALNSTIGEKAFYHCTGLKTIEIGGVTSIGWAAFSRDDNDKGATPGSCSIGRVVLSPALSTLGGSAFYKSTTKGCAFDAVLPKNMPGAKSGDGEIGGNAFQDLTAGSIVIPFKGTCTIGTKAFHWSSTTNFIFWGKAPTAWIGNSTAVFDAMKDFNTSVTADRRFTVSLGMDQEGWEGVATTLKKNCADGDWAELNPPENAFGYVTANTTRIWLCEGKSPWEPGGLLIFIR